MAVDHIGYGHAVTGQACKIAGLVLTPVYRAQTASARAWWYLPYGLQTEKVKGVNQCQVSGKNTDNGFARAPHITDRRAVRDPCPIFRVEYFLLTAPGRE